MLCGDLNVLDLVASYAKDMQKRKSKAKLIIEGIKDLQSDLQRIREDTRVILFAGAETLLKVKDEGLKVKVMQDEIREREMRALGNRLVASTVSVGFFLGALFSYGLKMGWVSGFPAVSIILLLASFKACLSSSKRASPFSIHNFL